MLLIHNLVVRSLREGLSFLGVTPAPPTDWFFLVSDLSAFTTSTWYRRLEEAAQMQPEAIFGVIYNQFAQEEAEVNPPQFPNPPPTHDVSSGMNYAAHREIGAHHERHAGAPRPVKRIQGNLMARLDTWRLIMASMDDDGEFDEVVDRCQVPKLVIPKLYMMRWKEHLLC